ncbi:hypothetical protein [Glycomyces sp. YM15]|uniref:hypothetical protein n=1 Tax=Glycomyces sp. YM15 TaxID=2800446 RepID=UPI001964F258|nr:hypothetical protein [Glycomyces sp. YM15]
MLEAVHDRLGPGAAADAPLPVTDPYALDPAEHRLASRTGAERPATVDQDR